MKAVPSSRRPAVQKLARWFHEDLLHRFADARSGASAYVEMLGPSQRKALREELIVFLASLEGVPERVLRQELAAMGAKAWPPRGGIRPVLVAVLIQASKQPGTLANDPRARPEY